MDVNVYMYMYMHVSELSIVGLQYKCLWVSHFIFSFWRDLWSSSLSSAAFVKGDKPRQFPRLQIRYKKGVNPTLKLLDDTNTVQDTLA